MNQGPILIIDDDADDRELLVDALKELKVSNEVLFFNNGDGVLTYLKSETISPFLILCDVNLPKMDGFELKEKILENTKANYKSIPFVYWSSEPSKAQIQKAFDLGGNGFFVKGNKFKDIKQSLLDIVNYWLTSKVPSK